MFFVVALLLKFILSCGFRGRWVLFVNGLENFNAKGPLARNKHRAYIFGIV